MSQQFDTGLAVPQRTAVRAAVVAKLLPLLKANGLYMQAVKPLAKAYTGKGDEAGSALLDTALQGQMPAALVALADKKYAHVSLRQNVMRGDLEVIVYVASANPRAMDDGRLAPDVSSTASVAADPGIEAMLEHVEELLLGQDLGVAGAGIMQPTHEGETFTGAQYSIFEIRFDVKLDRRINPDRGITARVLSIQSDQDLDGADPANPIVQTLTTLEAK